MEKVTLPIHDLASFDVYKDDKQYPKHWYVYCRTCGLTWYLPKDPARRTKDAINILADHAAAHANIVRLVAAG
jgi:hypothetical protein